MNTPELTRRGFLVQCLALAVAPAIVRAEWLMPGRNRSTGLLLAKGYLSDPDAWFIKTDCPDGLKYIWVNARYESNVLPNGSLTAPFKTIADAMAANPDLDSQLLFVYDRHSINS